MPTKRTPETIATDAERKERLAQALRENLKRRKAQARGRKDEEPAAREPKPPRGG
jgi:hypothetical protein